MMNVITDKLDIWVSAEKPKITGGRGRGTSNNKSPRGIQKLRELILELAMRGKLAPQDPDDEPASVLLEKIAAEKARLVKKGKIKKQKVLPEIGEDEKPFGLPKGWCWTRLGNISADIHYGYTASADQQIKDVRLLRITDIQNDSVNWELVPGCEIEEKKVADYQLKGGDILIARTGGTIGKSYLVSGIDLCSVFASYLIRVRYLEKMFPNFIKTYLGSQLYWEQLYANSMGTGQPNVNGNALKNLVFALPPLAEQHRIVAKVDELMALCDQMEQRQTDSGKAHQTLVESLLATFTVTAGGSRNAENAGAAFAQDNQQFQTAWNRIAQRFDTLFTTEHSIDQLKQTILQLAVMGRLVSQDPNDEPASVLLEKIVAEKKQLVKKGKIKKQKALPEIGENEKPFELPKGWSWTRLGGISADIHYGYTASADQQMKDVRLLRITDIQNGSVNWELVPGCEIEEKKVADYQLKDGDILIARTGGTIGKSYLVSGINLCSVFASYLIRVRHLEEMFPDFIKTYLGSRLYWRQLYASSMGTGQPNVNGNALKNLVFALPPLAEQHRIVAKVNELMMICDSLKEGLKEAQSTQVQLADAIVEQALA